MAEIKIPEVRPSGTIEGKVDALYDAYFVLRKYMTYYLSGNLDEENVIRAQEAEIANVLAGIIKADQIDVTEGKIHAAQIETLTVGNNVTMGPNATISWGQISNPPTAADIGARPDDWMPTASDVGALPWNTYIPVVPIYIKATYIDQANIISPFITGGVLTGGTVRTAASGERLSMDSNGLISYNSSNNKSGIAIENSEYGYSELNFYQNGMIVGQFMYDSYGGLSLSGLNDVVMHPRGNWDFSETTITGLDAGGTYKFG